MPGCRRRCRPASRSYWVVRVAICSSRSLICAWSPSTTPSDCPRTCWERKAMKAVLKARSRTTASPGVGAFNVITRISGVGALTDTAAWKSSGLSGRFRAVMAFCATARVRRKLTSVAIAVAGSSPSRWARTSPVVAELPGGIRWRAAIASNAPATMKQAKVLQRRSRAALKKCRLNSRLWVGLPDPLGSDRCSSASLLTAPLPGPVRRRRGLGDDPGDPSGNGPCSERCWSRSRPVVWSSGSGSTTMTPEMGAPLS